MLKYIRRHALDIALWAVFALCVPIAFKSSSDTFPAWIEGMWLETVLTQFPTGNQIAFDVSIGVLVSLLIYVLVARIPEFRKRERLRTNLRRQYSNLKGECIMNFLWACDEPADLDLIEKLKDLTAFHDYFKQRVTADHDRWDAVCNGLDATRIKALSEAMTDFRRELSYTMATIDIDDPQTFALLRNLTRALHASERWSDDYDEVKALSRFMWSLHTGWDWVKGYTGKDSVSDLIDSI